jgi:hypothetical protein
MYALAKDHKNDQIKEDNMGRARSADGRLIPTLLRWKS